MLTLAYVSKDKDYTNYVVKLVKNSKSKVCYVSLNKSCKSLFSLFEKKGINKEKLYFVDCISAMFEAPDKIKNCDYVSAPYNLGEVSAAINAAIHKGHVFVIFDSLSNLLIWGSSVPAGVDILISFIRKFLPELNAKNGNAVFICSSKDKGNLVIEESRRIFDAVKEVK